MEKLLCNLSVNGLPAISLLLMACEATSLTGAANLTPENSSLMKYFIKNIISIAFATVSLSADSKSNI